MPQFLHCHGWLAGGLASLEKLFPGFVQDTVSYGALLPSKGQAWTVCPAVFLELVVAFRACFKDGSCFCHTRPTVTEKAKSWVLLRSLVPPRSSCLQRPEAAFKDYREPALCMRES